MNERSKIFKERDHNRYWWHRAHGTNYVPLIYSILDDQEWLLMQEWFDDTEQHFSSTDLALV